MNLNFHPENLDYFYVKPIFFCDYPINYPLDMQNPYIIFKLEIEDNAKIDYHYIIKDTLIFTDFKNQTQLNNYVNDEYSGIFICKQKDKLCLWNNSLYGLNPRSIINFREHDVFYNNKKLDSNTLEDLVKEILFEIYIN